MKKTVWLTIAILSAVHCTLLASEVASRYADHSVLSSGRWVKIRVAQTGVHELTDELLTQAGFSDPAKVKIFGYGGAMQPEKLTANYVASTDDLKEIVTCTVGGRRLFYAVGSVSWQKATETIRTRNPYSDYGYYFLTEGGDDPLAADSAEFAKASWPAPCDYHTLYEVDDYCWYHGGRNLYDQRLLPTGTPQEYTLGASSASGVLTVVMSYDNYCEAEVAVNDSVVGKILINASTASKTNKKLKSLPDDYSLATADTWEFNVKGNLKAQNTIAIKKISGANMRLDYVSITSTVPRPFPCLSDDPFPAPELVGSVESQDLHADPQADMVIIIPTNGVMRSAAERLKALHEDYDGLRVNIVKADQLYNEFSSGTPDANAYRRYLKMLYDRATDVDDRPRYLLLFGDGAWDNRMLSTNWRSTSPDDFLLCYESDNSFSETKCYVSDDYFCLLDDNEGEDMLTDKIDVAVGRFPARDEGEASILVDKTYSYRMNANAGAWQNTIFLMGDDGDKNRHMNDEEMVAAMLEQNHPGYNTRKIYWDAYEKIDTNGSKYPEVTNLIRQQMQNGALIMNYSGHGNPGGLSHESVLSLADFKLSSQMRFPLWITASCDIMPFDGQEENLGETAMFNPEGGAIAFFGTTRTVYAAWNRPLNISFTNHVLSSVEGRRNTIGEAAMKAKNEFTVGSSRDMIVNKQQYTLLGDPALVLAAPTLEAVIDEIDGSPANSSSLRLMAGTQVTVNGHIEGSADFNGMVTLTVRDVEEKVKCRMNAYAKGDTAMVYTHRPNTVFTGSNSVKNGVFSFTFTVPKDISYADENGQMLIYAINDEGTVLAHGENDNFSMGGGENLPNDGVGPQIYCFLENESFSDGATVGTEPYFYAMLKDDDGINVSGNGIGHDVELIIDSRLSYTYNLNNRFEYSFGDYTTGTVEYTLPQLNAGKHHMLFRAWDVLNNSSIVEYDFYVADRGTAGIDDVLPASDGFAGEGRQPVFFDLQGRTVGRQQYGRGRARLVLQRDKMGRVKKMVVAGQ